MTLLENILGSNEFKELSPAATHTELGHVQQVQRGGGHEVDQFK